MAEDNSKFKVTAKVRIKKFRPDQNPETDEPYEVVELEETDVTEEFLNLKDVKEVQDAGNR